MVPWFLTMVSRLCAFVGTVPFIFMAISKNMLDLPSDYSEEGNLVAVMNGNELVRVGDTQVVECDECAGERSYDVNIDPHYLRTLEGDVVDSIIFLEDTQLSFIEENGNACEVCESPYGDVHKHFSNARQRLSAPRSLTLEQMRKLANAHRCGRLYNKASDYNMYCVWWNKTNINFMTTPPPALDAQNAHDSRLMNLCNPWSFPVVEAPPPVSWSDAWKTFFRRSGEIFEKWLEVHDVDPPTSPPYTEFADFDYSPNNEIVSPSVSFLSQAALPELEKWRDEVGQALDAIPNSRPARQGSMSFRFQVLLAVIASIKGAQGAVVETSDAVSSVGWALFPFALIFCLLYVVVKFSSLFEFVVKEGMRYFETTITTLLAEVHLFNQQVCGSIPMAKLCFDRWLTVNSTYQWYGLVLQACGIGAGLLSAFTNVGFGWYNTNAMASMFAMEKQAFPRKAQGYNKFGVFLSVCIAALMFIGAPVLGCATVNKKFDPFLRLLEKLPYVTWLFDWIKSFFAGKASTSTIPTSVREFAKGEYVETDRPTAFDWSSGDEEETDNKGFKETDHDLEACSEYCFNVGIQCCLSNSCCCTCHVIHENRQKLEVEKEEVDAHAPPGVAHPLRDAYQEKVDLHQKSMTESVESRLERTFIQMWRQEPIIAHKFAKKQRERGCKFFTDSKIHTMANQARGVPLIRKDKYFMPEVKAALSIMSDEYTRLNAPEGAIYCNFQLFETVNGRGWKCTKCSFCSQNILLRECSPAPQPFPVCGVCGQDKTKASPVGAACDHLPRVDTPPPPPSPPPLKTPVRPIPPVPLKSGYLRTHFVPATVSVTTVEGDKAFLFIKKDEVSHVKLEPIVQELAEDLVKQAINGKPVEEFKACRDCSCAPCLGEQLHTVCPGKREKTARVVLSFEKQPTPSWWDRVTALFIEALDSCHDFYLAHTSKVIAGFVAVLVALVGAAVYLGTRRDEVMIQEKGASKRSRVKHVRPPPPRGAPRKWIDSGGSEIRADDVVSGDYDDNLRAAGLDLRTASDLGDETGYSREAFAPVGKTACISEALAKLHTPASKEPRDVARVSRAISHAKSYRLVVTPKEVRSFLQQRALVKESLLGHVRLDNQRFIPYVFKLVYGDNVVSSATAVCDKIVVPLHAHQSGVPSAFNACYDVTLKESDLTPIAQDLGVYFHHGAVAINKGWHMRPPGNEQVILYGFDASNDDEPTMGVGYCNSAGVYDAPSQVGNCGGPVVAATDGHLVGFHIGGGTKVNKFVPLTGELIERLKMSRSVLQASLFL